MDRREALKYTALSLGTALSASATAALLQGCSTPTGPDWSPQTVSPDQAYFLEEVAETLLPATDTPGARDAGVAPFIDQLFTDWASAKSRQLFTVGIDQLRQALREKSGTDFTRLGKERRTAVLAEFNREALTEEVSAEQTFWLELKGNIISAYFSAQLIGTEVLAYDPIPGAYEGCIPLVENGGRAWSL